MNVYSKNEVALRNEEDVMFEYLQKKHKKGYVRIVTNKGDLNFELHADLAPKTCQNFIGLAKKGFYKHVTFHRNIKNFMIQGGDPSGNGKGGESLWGKNVKFRDEFHTSLSHTGPGILSMANSGPNSNTSQFFVTYKSCKHLDNKHTIFGKLVGGLEVLKLLESLPVDKNDKPLEPVIMLDVVVFVDPFEDYFKDIEEAEQKKEEEKLKEKDNERGQWFSNPVHNKQSTTNQGVGKYLNSNQGLNPNKNPATVGQKRTQAEADSGSVATIESYEQQGKKKKLPTSNLSDFSSW